MQDQSWIKLHRQILENHFLMHDKNAWWVFTQLLLRVGKQKGEWAGSVRELADKHHLNMSYATLYSALKRLEKEQIIKQDNKQRYTVISICNWGTYQTTGKQQSKPVASTRQAHGKQLTEVKNPQNKKENKTNTGSKKIEPKPVAKAYYDAVTALGLPTVNHTTLQTKIRALEKELGEERAVNYLNYVADHYNEIEMEYKPELNQSIDLYAKHIQVRNALKRLYKNDESRRYA